MRINLSIRAVRVSPLMPWERHRTTWEDILDEIEENDGLENVMARMTQSEQDIASLRRLMKQNALLTLHHQELMFQIAKNIDHLVAILIKEFGREE